MSYHGDLGIISQQLFEDYTKAWDGFIGSASADELTDLFRTQDGTYLPFVSLPCEQLVWLLSTPGMQQVKARFALLPTASGQQSRFAVALFATDKDEAPVSACYLATGTWQPVQMLPEACKTALEDGHVPLALADAWLKNWTEASVVTPVMFATHTTPLQGYNFTVRDFVDPLFAFKAGGSDQTLRIYFGLHDYYRATEATAAPSFGQTLGLVLRLAGAGISEAPYYDMASPCPPAP